MSDPTRGITCPDTRRVVREALANGWEWLGNNGSTHPQIRWPATGQVLHFGATPSAASWKSLATDIKRASGVTVWRKGNRKRSRKADQVSGFGPSAARRESAQWHRIHDGEVDGIEALRSTLIEQVRELAKDRTQLRRIPPMLDQIKAAEERLGLMGRPVEPFDPYSLGSAA